MASYGFICFLRHSTGCGCGTKIGSAEDMALRWFDSVGVLILTSRLYPSVWTKLDWRLKVHGKSLEKGSWYIIRPKRVQRKASSILPFQGKARGRFGILSSAYWLLNRGEPFWTNQWEKDISELVPICWSFIPDLLPLPHTGHHYTPGPSRQLPGTKFEMPWPSTNARRGNAARVYSALRRFSLCTLSRRRKTKAGNMSQHVATWVAGSRIYTLA
jgi:hypothetical protein